MSVTIRKRQRAPKPIPYPGAAPAPTEAWRSRARDLARAVLVFAALGGMPDTFWLTDRRVRLAAATLGISTTIARTYGRRRAATIRARRGRR